MADFAKAIDEIGPSVQPEDGQGKLDWARKAWFSGDSKTGLPAKSVIPGCDSWDIAQALIRDGADPWELRYSGFDTDIRFYRALEAAGKCWKGHAAKIEELRGVVRSVSAAE